MIARRRLLFALGACMLAAGLRAAAQSQGRARRIGFFSGGSLQSMAARLDGFREGMAALRWVEGRDYVIDARYGDGLAQALPRLAAELVSTQPDLLLTTADAPARLLAQRTKSIPIVFTLSQDPVANGVAASLQQPGGNVTGLTTLARDLGAKRLQLLKEALPRVAHLVLLFDPADVGSKSEVKVIGQAAGRLEMRVTPIELRQPADIEPAFKRGAALGAQAYMVTQGFLTNAERQAIADRITNAKVPAIAGIVEYAEAGVLMSYAPSFRENFRRAATYVDKIFKGARPGDLPIEQPVKFELVLNLKSARAMGITIPRSFLVHADRVIE